jgi:predicted MFS family arabinose efflux permease
MGKMLVAAGLIIAGIGLAMLAGFPIGKLPGDLVIRRGSFTLYLPIMSSIVVSLALTVLLSLLRR